MDTLGSVFLTTLWIFLLFAWLMVLFYILSDLFRDHQLSGWLKAVWIVLLIFVPFLTALVYLIARGKGMQERAMTQARQVKQAQDEYIRDVAGGAGPSPTDQIAQAQKLLDTGAITPEEFQRLKAKALA
jgi:hypothetical protein